MTNEEVDDLADQAVRKMISADGVWPDKGACSECFFSGMVTAIRGLHLLGRLNMGGEKEGEI